MKHISLSLSSLQGKPSQPSKKALSRSGSTWTMHDLEYHMRVNFNVAIDELFSPKEKKVLGFMLFVVPLLPYFNMAHEKIAFKTKTSISTVQHTFNLMRHLKMMDWDLSWSKTRNRRNTCTYKINTYFLRGDIRISIMNMVQKSLWLLVLIPGLGKNYREYKNDIYINKLTRVNPYAAMRNAHAANTEKRELMQSDILRCRALHSFCKKLLAITPHGIAKIASYPANAIAFAETQIPKALATDHPWEYLIQVLERYCMKIEQKPDVSIYAALKRGFNVEELDTTYLDESRLAAEQQVPKKGNAVVPKKVETPIIKPQIAQQIAKTPVLSKEDIPAADDPFVLWLANHLEAEGGNTEIKAAMRSAVDSIKQGNS